MPRIVIAFGSFWSGLLLCTVVSLGHKSGTGFKKWQLMIVRGAAPIVSRLVTYTGLYIPVVRRVECDYSNYLGPDYEYSYEGAGIYVSNHCTTFDVTMHQGMIKPFTSFLGKADATKFPGVGGLCEILGQLLVVRESKDKEARTALIQ